MLWQCIKKLLGKEGTMEEELEVYDEGNRKLSSKDAADEIERVFREICKSGRKDLTPIYSGRWGEGAKERLEAEYEREAPGKIELEGVTVYMGNIPMGKVRMTMFDLNKELEDLK